MADRLFISGHIAPFFIKGAFPRLRRDSRTDMATNGSITHQTLPVH